MNIELDKKELKFFNAYKEAIYFTDTGDADQPGSDIALCEVFERESVIDCLAFFNRIQCYLSDDQIEQAGHDFWLTRNGHGTGFWDRKDYYNADYYSRFSQIAGTFGTVHAVFEEMTE
jgi:hypothetical protein